MSRPAVALFRTIALCVRLLSLLTWAFASLKERFRTLRLLMADVAVEIMVHSIEVEWKAV